MMFAFCAAVMGDENMRKKKKKKKHHKVLGEVGEVQCKTNYQLKSSEEIPPLDTSQWPLLLKVANLLLFMVNSRCDAITAVTLIVSHCRTLTSCVAGQITTPPCHLELHHLRGTYVNMCVQDTSTLTSLPIQVLMK
jgi:hypothetical protein